MNWMEARRLADEIKQLAGRRAAEVVGSAEFNPQKALKQTAPNVFEMEVPLPYANRKVTVSGSSPEEAMAAYKALRDPKWSATETSPNINQIKQIREVQNRVSPEEATQVLGTADPDTLKRIAGVGGVAAGLGALAPNRASAESLSPIQPISSGIDWYKQHIQEPTEQAIQPIAQSIVSGTTPMPEGPQKQQFVQENAPLVGDILNPTNYIPGIPEAETGMWGFEKLKNRLK